MNTPTEKQISFAKQIAEVLKIKLPCDYTNFCHRHLVADWFRKNGIECKEYE